jgi:predicted Zn-dependent peptidase
MDIVTGIFRDLLRDGISEDELTKARNKVLSALVIKNELPMGRLVDLGFNWMYLGQYRSVEEDVEAIKAVRVEEVNTLIRELDLSRFTQYSLGPTAA